MQPSHDDSMPRQDVDSRDPTTYLAEDPALIVSGVLVHDSCLIQVHASYSRSREGVRTMGKPSKLALFVAIALSAAGLAMAVDIGTQKAATHFPSAAGKVVRAIEPGNETR
jgi:hypothetical protein